MEHIERIGMTLRTTICSARNTREEHKPCTACEAIAVFGQKGQEKTYSSGHVLVNGSSSRLRNELRLLFLNSQLFAGKQLWT